MFDKEIYTKESERKQLVILLLRLDRVLSFFLVILRFSLTVISYVFVDNANGR